MFDDVKKFFATFFFLLLAAIALATQGTFNSVHGQTISDDVSVVQFPIPCVDAKQYKMEQLAAGNSVTLLGAGKNYLIVLYFSKKENLFSVHYEYRNGLTCQMVIGDALDEGEGGVDDDPKGESTY